MARTSTSGVGRRGRGRGTRKRDRASEGEGEGEGEKCGPRPTLFDKNGEVLGERKHHVCVCDEGNSKRCYDSMFGDELYGMGDELAVFKSGFQPMSMGIKHLAN